MWNGYCVGVPGTQVVSRAMQHTNEMPHCIALYFTAELENMHFHARNGWIQANK